MFGTVKSNRYQLPRDAVFASNKRYGNERGHMEMHKCQITLNNSEVKDIYFTSWQDNKLVYLLSTFPSMASQLQECEKKDFGTLASKISQFQL